MISLKPASYFSRSRHKHKHDNEKIPSEESFFFTVLCHAYNHTKHRILELEGVAQCSDEKVRFREGSHVCEAHTNGKC